MLVYIVIVTVARGRATHEQLKELKDTILPSFEVRSTSITTRVGGMCVILLLNYFIYLFIYL